MEHQGFGIRSRKKKDGNVLKVSSDAKVKEGIEESEAVEKVEEEKEGNGKRKKKRKVKRRRRRKRSCRTR